MFFYFEKKKYDLLFIIFTHCKYKFTNIDKKKN